MQLDLGLGAPLTVSELTRKIKDVLEGTFLDVWVQGEVSGLRTPSSGHIYFTLKDKGAAVKCVFFRSGSRYLKFRPEDGLEVILRGRVSVYEPRGEYQIIAEYMEPKGLGALQLAFIQLKERLDKEGLFDPARKRPLPAYPKRVGVVTSTAGAAIRDILKVLRRRAPGVHVLIAPASVQGEAAPAEIAQGIRDLNAAGGVDVIIVGRGGGSYEDLAAFNAETVARAIYESGIPVISAVGHETDFTIADFVADLRAPTPSAAAEVVAGSEEHLRESLVALAGRLSFAARQRLRHVRSRISAERRALASPRKSIQESLLRVDDYSGRLCLAGRHQALYTRQRLERASVKLSLLEPLAPLGKGFALVKKLPGLTLVKKAGEAREGDALRLLFIDGELDCKVGKVTIKREDTT